MKFKVVFLDIDGVLNKHRGPAKAREPRKFIYDCLIDSSKVQLLNHLAKLDVRFVISSDWAKVLGPKATACVLTSHGFQGRYLFPEDLGLTEGPTKWNLSETDLLSQTLMTSESDPSHRGEEISLFLEKHGKYIERFVIIDDSKKIYPEHQSNFVWVENSQGLEIHHLEKAMEILGF